MTDKPLISVNDLQELSYCEIGEGFDDIELISLDNEFNERRWYVLADIVFKMGGSYWKSYYYKLIKSENIGLPDIIDLNSLVKVVEVFPEEKTIIVYKEKENN